MDHTRSGRISVKRPFPTRPDANANIFGDMETGFVPKFVTASHCMGGECVDVKIDTDRVWVRSTNDPGTVLEFTHDEWSAFIKGVKAGEFDLKLTKAS